MTVDPKLAEKITAAIAGRAAHCLKARGIHDAGGEFSRFIASGATRDVCDAIERHFDPNLTCPRCSELHDQPAICNWCKACSMQHDHELSMQHEHELRGYESEE